MIFNTGDFEDCHLSARQMCPGAITLQSDGLIGDINRLEATIQTRNTSSNFNVSEIKTGRKIEYNDCIRR